MPELPEVETAKRRAAGVLAGHTIKQVAAADDGIVFAGVTPRKLAATLRGRSVSGLGRRGKYFWIELDRRPWPVLHLGMTGRIVVYEEPAERPKFWKLELVADTGRRVAMTNARRLGRIRLVDDPLNEPPISRLGFDPLTDMASLADLQGALRGRKAPVKAVLLDQSFAAGVGNWIADEVLYQARISPHRRGHELGEDEVRRVRTALGRIVRKAVDVDADKARFPRTWLFHRRWGKSAGATTAKGQRIVHETVGGRTTAWVPDTQP